MLRQATLKHAETVRNRLNLFHNHRGLQSHAKKHRIYFEYSKAEQSTGQEKQKFSYAQEYAREDAPSLRSPGHRSFHSLMETSCAWAVLYMKPDPASPMEESLHLGGWVPPRYIPPNNGLTLATAGMQLVLRFTSQVHRRRRRCAAEVSS